MSTGQRRVRVTVTLSPKVLRLVDAKARQRPDKSRSAALESIVEQAELDRQVREYYANWTPEDEEEASFWEEAQKVSAAMDARDATRARKKSKS